jgi:hypothetical protein
VIVSGEALPESTKQISAELDGVAAHAGELAEALVESPAIVDTLSLVLSSTGGSLDLAFGPAFTMPILGQETAGVLRAERREAHRRTRRGKQRRRTINATELVQPKLFKNLK